MLDHKVGHYVHYDHITTNNKRNVLRSFMFIKQKILLDGNMDKRKERLRSYCTVTKIFTKYKIQNTIYEMEIAPLDPLNKLRLAKYKADCIVLQVSDC